MTALRLEVFSQMMHLGLIGAVVGVLVVLWLIPTLIGALFSGLWWLVKLPFRLVWLLVVEGVGGLFALLWRLFTGFFGLFGWVGTIVQWLVVIAAVVFGGMTLVSFFSGAKEQKARSKESGGQEDNSRKERSDPPPFAQRAWALKVMGLSPSASEADVKRRYHELVKSEHPDRLGPYATDAERAEAQKRMERINRAYEILTQ